MPSGPRPQPPTDTVRIAMSGTNSVLQWTNVYYLQLVTDGTRTAADLKTVTDGAVNAFHTRMTAQLSSSVTQTDAKAVWITGSGTALEYEGSYSNAFTGGTEVVYGGACIVVNWAINQYYRGGHPRMYLPGVIAANITAFSQITPTYQSAVAVAAANWLSDVNALTGVHVSATKLGTVSFARQNSWRTPPVFYGYTSAGVRNFLGTQRRRLGGR